MTDTLFEALGLAGYGRTVLSASAAGLLVGHALQRWFGIFVVLAIIGSRVSWIRSRFT